MNEEIMRQELKEMREAMTRELGNVFSRINDNHAETSRRFELMASKNAKHDTQIARLDERTAKMLEAIEHVSKDVGQIKYILNGNGKPGFVSMTITNEKRLNEIEPAVKSNTFQVRVMWGIGVLAVGAAIAFLASMIGG